MAKNFREVCAAIVREGDPATATQNWPTPEQFAEWIIEQARLAIAQPDHSVELEEWESEFAVDALVRASSRARRRSEAEMYWMLAEKIGEPHGFSPEEFTV